VRRRPDNKGEAAPAILVLASWKAQQWRIFALSAVYGLAWLRGL
jgi:hypothetical protein